MDEDEIICNVCKKKENDESKVITCLYCFSNAHFKCKNIIGSAIRRIKETDYFCTPNCSAIYQRIVSMQDKKNLLMSSFAAEMKATISNSVANEMLSVSSELKQITASIEKSQEFLSAKFDKIVVDFKELKLENEKLKSEIEKLKYSHIQLQHTVNKLEANVDKSDKVALNNNVVVWGIPMCPDDNVSQIVGTLLSCLGLNKTSELITSVERMFVNHKGDNALVPIRIVFRDSESKALVLNKKKQFGKLLATAIDKRFVNNGRALTITLRDELTPLSLELLKELRQSQELLNIKYIWAGRGGIILVKKDENCKPELVKNRDDLNRIMRHYMNSTETTGNTPVSVNSPSPKRKKSFV